jgi:hypothetical protein
MKSRPDVKHSGKAVTILGSRSDGISPPVTLKMTPWTSSRALQPMRYAAPTAAYNWLYGLAISPLELPHMPRQRQGRSERIRDERPNGRGGIDRTLATGWHLTKSENLRVTDQFVC